MANTSLTEPSGLTTSMDPDQTPSGSNYIYSQYTIVGILFEHHMQNSGEYVFRCISQDSNLCTLH